MQPGLSSNWADADPSLSECGDFLGVNFFSEHRQTCKPREMAIFDCQRKMSRTWHGWDQLPGDIAQVFCTGIAEQAALGAAVSYVLQLLLSFYHWLIFGTGSCVIPSSWVSSYECRRCCGATQGLLDRKHGLLVLSVLLGSKGKEAGTTILLTGRYFWHGKPSTWFADTDSPQPQRWNLYHWTL